MPTTTNPRVELLLDDWRGVHIPRDFAEEWSDGWWYPPEPGEHEVHALERWQRDMYYLQGGHEQQDYWETWDDVLANAVGRPTTPHLKGPNPFAGWVLDQGSGEDSCLRTYHPDDRALVFGDDED